MADVLENNLRPADKRNYQTSKRASLWFRKEGLLTEADWEEFGYIVDPSETLTQQLLEHYANRRGQRAIDRTEIAEQKLELKFSIEEMTTENLRKAFGGTGDDKADGTVKIREGRVVKNAGAGLLINLKMEGINAADVVVRDPGQEGTPAVYDAEAIATDTTDDTAGGTLNNTTDPITILAATYPNTPTAVGSLIKIEDEILRVTATGASLTLARAQLGTDAAAHANGVSIFKTNGGDYVVDEVNGKVYITVDGDLDDASAIPELHVQWTKTVETETFSIFDGTTLRGEAQLQILTKKGARLVAYFPSVELRNNGDISFGTGQDFLRIPLVLLILSDEDGSLGAKHIINADQAI